MEQEHPIPQEISTYQFRLVGDMTIKQFMQVAAGALVALFVYSSGLPSYVKWPLIIVSFLFGIALAFFPLEDRPLSKWIVLFVKAIYSPTIYVWKKGASQHAYFQQEPGTTQQPISTTGALPQTPQATTQPSGVQVAPVDEFHKLEKSEQEFLSKVNQHFTAPALQVKTTIIPPPGTRKKIVIPKDTSIKVEGVEKEELVPEVPEARTLTQTGETITPLATQRTANLQQATFSLEAAPPTPPTKPNVIVGQVLDSEGKILENAILEIKDYEGRPVRALKSNKLGHFMIVTPLTDGPYEIITEKEGFKFEPLSFEAKNEIIPPIAIWAKKSEENKA